MLEAVTLLDRVRENTRPFLEPGEEPKHVFLAQTGPNPALSAVTWLTQFRIKRRIVVVTDRAIVVLRAGRVRAWQPQGVASRLPRSTRIGPLDGMWTQVRLGDEELWVRKSYATEVAAADAELG